jgi:hypothetical protein
LGSYEDKGDFVHAPVLGHLGVVVVDGVEAGLVLQAEHKDDGIHPGGELKNKRGCLLDEQRLKTHERERFLRQKR